MEWHRGEERGRISRGRRADCPWPGFSCCLSSRGMHCPLERGNALLRMEKSMLCWYLGNSCQCQLCVTKWSKMCGGGKEWQLAVAAPGCPSGTLCPSQKQHPTLAASFLSLQGCLLEQQEQSFSGRRRHFTGTW